MVKDFWVVIPAYNEARNIRDVVEGAKKYSSNIIVVDDGSKDKTYYNARKTNAIVLRHIVNLGKGAALKTGCDFAVMHKARKIVVLDADGQHDPNETPKFVKLLEDYDIVFGYRRFTNDMPFVLKFGNVFINYAINLLYGMRLKDTQCGYRAFTANAYKKIRWKALDYSMESEMIANTGKHKLKYKEIQIETIYSDKYKGTTIIDGIKIVFNMLLWRLRIRDSSDNGMNENNFIKVDN